MTHLFLTLLTALSFSLPTLCVAQDSPSVKKVYISKIVDHAALDATTKGIVDALEKKGYKAGKNLKIRIESAQANPALAQQIATKYINQDPDVVVGVGTVTAQSFAKQAAAGKVKLVFSSVTDPLKAGLVQSLDQPGHNTTGVSNFLDLKPQLALFKKLQPYLKNLGFLYNPGEVNSVVLKEELETLCPEFGLTLVCQSIHKTAEVAQNAIKLAQNADAIFISNDNTALSSLQSVIKAAQGAKIPVYVSDTDAVSMGAVAALGPNQYEIGLQTGDMIARLLDGGAIELERVQFPTKTDLYLNVEAARGIGMEIPVDLIQSATKVFKGEPS
jgi:putative ABC transport system substrate-binding protein